MSLAVAALRICLVKALDLETSAGKRVFDSTVDPRNLIDKEAAPTIVVLAERGKRKVEGRDILAADHIVELAVEMFVAKATIVSNTGDDKVIFNVDYPATDAAHENRLRRLSYEVDSIIAGSLSPWAELLRSFAVKFGDTADWDRGADGDGGRRFNFLRNTYPVEVLADPVRGQPLSPVWEKFISMMEADAELAMLGKDWRALITTPGLPEWRRAMASLGLTYAELQGIGLAPFLDHQPNNETEAAPLGEAVLDPDQIVVDPI
jgi:hypothetical protein